MKENRIAIAGLKNYQSFDYISDGFTTGSKLDELDASSDYTDEEIPKSQNDTSTSK